MSSYDKNNPPIIRKKDAVPWVLKHSLRLINTLFWGMFLWLFRPLLTFIGWIISTDFLIKTSDRYWTFIDVAKTLLLYLLAVIALGIILIGWAKYNQFRFQKKDRRNRFKPGVDNKSIATYYAIGEELVEQTQTAKIAVMKHNKEGHLINLEVVSQSLESQQHEVLLISKTERHYRGAVIRQNPDDRNFWTVNLKGQNARKQLPFQDCVNLIDQVLTAST
ncbi:MAG: poly-beta-1,6-N-acetyl-D-glucosamine biosynthesis protein PgaD [Desulfuromusa sp.]|nr:poly-beta-1,6-N-acetyl-D-glucosamine biosynthesis protein PgaD [Desulfuromusa sp.]